MSARGGSRINILMPGTYGYSEDALGSAHRAGDAELLLIGKAAHYHVVQHTRITAPAINRDHRDRDRDDRRNRTFRTGLRWPGCCGAHTDHAHARPGLAGCRGC